MKLIRYIVVWFVLFLMLEVAWVLLTPLLPPGLIPPHRMYRVDVGLVINFLVIWGVASLGSLPLGSRWNRKAEERRARIYAEAMASALKDKGR